MKNIFIYILELLILILLMIVPPLFVWIDFTILKTNLSEYSLTEFTQEFLILASFIILFFKTYKNRENRGFLILPVGLFLVMFIREGDYYWDKIMNGLWTILAVSTFLISVYIAYRQRQTIIPTLSTYWNTRGFGYLIVGLLIVLLFSRIFGTGDLWRAILKENYIGYYKTAIQEGLELLGYLIIFYGVILMSRSSLNVTKIKD
ncbi:hypothetical protein OAU59_01620 [Winogradskyella sp.]|jgi:hypothetical protein|nr:hypothetical protein [Winogradskyella sp.]